MNVDAHTQNECVWKKLDLSRYSAFITTDLIWIQLNAERPNVWRQLELAGDRPLVPISVGLQASSISSDFSLHPDTVKLLRTLSERCVLGCRGSYTADVLEKYGIVNTAVIGCPSMYLPFDSNFRIQKENTEIKSVCTNLRSLYSKLTTKEVDFLTYAARNNYDFCEQTKYALTPKICGRSETFNQLNEWMNLYKMFF